MKVSKSRRHFFPIQPFCWFSYCNRFIFLFAHSFFSVPYWVLWCLVILQNHWSRYFFPRLQLYRIQLYLNSYCNWRVLLYSFYILIPLDGYCHTHGCLRFTWVSEHFQPFSASDLFSAFQFYCHIVSLCIPAQEQQDLKDD